MQHAQLRLVVPDLSSSANPLGILLILHTFLTHSSHISHPQIPALAANKGVDPETGVLHDGFLFTSAAFGHLIYHNMLMPLNGLTGGAGVATQLSELLPYYQVGRVGRG